MQLIALEAVRDGMTLGKTIWNDAGHPLLQQGVRLNERSIKRLEQLNVQYIYIDTALSKGIEVVETVPHTVRNCVVKEIRQSFEAVQKADKKKIAYVLEQKAYALSKDLDELIKIIMESGEALMVLSDAFLYDEYIYQHSFQVTLYALAIAKHLKYSEKDLKTIGMGALLHDIGKISIPQEILQKPSRLTEQEYEEMKEHTKYGFELLRNLYTMPLLVAHCAFQHHERLDGTGYPRGLTEKEIHPFAKIIAVADVFDALSSMRVYRKKILPVECLKIMAKGEGTEFDPIVLEALRKCIVHYPNGTILQLEDERRGIVIRQNPINPLRPVLRVFEEQGQILKATYELVLIDFPTLKIVEVQADYVLNKQ
ncbi:MAG TPA: HD-GYP domain-containing protein [Metalysinibacillus jejuensis]|uniref:HD-GYP domain-containing protein n=1 Tax=Metalysinibacillus jejuensis TaxID=914327 RepID=A0A921NBW4_9BACL|nr:HD-GYP domain-containing protein [Metalysinibacillus jejuensis]